LGQATRPGPKTPPTFRQKGAEQAGRPAPGAFMDHDRQPDRDRPPTTGPDLGLDAAPPPEEIAEQAGTLLVYVRRALEFELDQTADTLPVLDHYVGLVHESLAARPEFLPVVAPAVAAYFGEVVRTNCRAFGPARTESGRLLPVSPACVPGFSPARDCV